MPLEERKERYPACECRHPACLFSEELREEWESWAYPAEFRMAVIFPDAED